MSVNNKRQQGRKKMNFRIEIGRGKSQKVFKKKKKN